MIAVFYDKKNKREVTSKQLLLNNGTAGSYGYKSETCDPSLNWDLSLKETDLIFLRLEEDYESGIPLDDFLHDTDPPGSE